MNLTPREKDKLLVAMAAIVARRRLERGVKLNHPEAVALVSDFVVEGARDGRSVADLMEAGRPGGDARPGDGGHRRDDPRRSGGGDLSRWNEACHGARADPMIDPGEVITVPGVIELNAGLDRTALSVANTGDRPIQVGSHYHFAETNPSLHFDRAVARGMRLDIPAGTAVRFEPGQTREVTLIPYRGSRVVWGFRGAIMGALD